MWRSSNRIDADVEAVVRTIPLAYVKKGVTQSNFDLLSASCCLCKIDDVAFRVADLLFEMGYTYKFGCSSDYGEIARKKRWKLFHYLMDRSGAYKDLHRLRMCIKRLDQRNLDPFLDRGISMDSSDRLSKPHFFAFRAAREKARIASIALVGVGRWKKRVDAKGSCAVMRVISRVVWSERCDEKWLEN